MTIITDKKQAIVLTGPPGCGKSTILECMQEKYNAVAIETGRLLREQAEKETRLGEEVRPYLDKGQLVPTEIVNRVVEETIRSTRESLLLVNGYPRNRDEIQHLREMEDGGFFEPAFIVVLHLTRETAVKRIAGRRKCSDCGSTYNVNVDPPKQPHTCDSCKGALEQRKDDRPEVVDKRLDIFENETLPAIEIFQALRPSRTINLSAENSLNTVLFDVVQLLKNIGVDMENHRRV
jgi:adenylate kinase